MFYLSIYSLFLIGACATGPRTRAARTACTIDAASFVSSLSCNLSHLLHVEVVLCLMTVNVSYEPLTLNSDDNSASNSSNEHSVNGKMRWFLSHDRLLMAMSSVVDSLRRFIAINAGFLLVAASQAFFSLMNLAVKKLNSLDPPVPTLEVRFVVLLLYPRKLTHPSLLSSEWCALLSHLSCKAFMSKQGITYICCMVYMYVTDLFLLISSHYFSLSGYGRRFPIHFSVPRKFDYFSCSEASRGEQINLLIPRTWPSHNRNHLSFSFFGLFGIYYSLNYLSLSDATVLTFLSPMTTALAGAIFLHEAFSKREALAGREYRFFTGSSAFDHLS